MENDDLTLQEQSYFSSIQNSVTLFAFENLDIGGMTPAQCLNKKTEIENALLEINTLPIPPRMAILGMSNWTLHVSSAGIEAMEGFALAAAAKKARDPDLAEAAARHFRHAAQMMGMAENATNLAAAPGESL